MTFNRKRKILVIAFALFVVVNVVSYQHAYKFTHFSTEDVSRTSDPASLSSLAKIRVLITGVDNPRPKLKAVPDRPYETHHVKSRNLLECWSIKSDSARGTVILFHGFSGEKSSLLARAEEFLKLGYNTFLVDFSGSGGSEGNATTIGYDEAEEVRDCLNYVSATGEKNIILFGTSMGAAAILKANQDYDVASTAIILECPFGSLYKTVSARFSMMHVPSFPMAGFLTFWGGVQQGYWAFSHNPYNYATAVTSPTLLLYGQLDERVSQEETDKIFENLAGRKVLKNYAKIGHDVYTHNQQAWRSDVSDFIKPL